MVVFLGTETFWMCVVVWTFSKVDLSSGTYSLAVTYHFFLQSFVTVSRYCLQTCKKILKYEWNVYIFITEKLFNQEHLLSVSWNTLSQQNLLRVYIFKYVCVYIVIVYIYFLKCTLVPKLKDKLHIFNSKTFAAFHWDFLGFGCLK